MWELKPPTHPLWPARTKKKKEKKWSAYWLASSPQSNGQLASPAWRPPPLSCIATPSVLLSCLMTVIAAVAQGRLIKPPDRLLLLKTWKLTDLCVGTSGYPKTSLRQILTHTEQLSRHIYEHAICTQSTQPAAYELPPSHIYKSVPHERYFTLACKHIKHNTDERTIICVSLFHSKHRSWTLIVLSYSLHKPTSDTVIAVNLNTSHVLDWRSNH